MQGSGIAQRGPHPQSLPRWTQPWPPSSFLSSLPLPPTVLLPMAAMAKFLKSRAFLLKALPWLYIALRPKPTGLPAAQRTRSGPASAASPAGLLTPALLMHLLPPEGLCTCHSFCLELTSCLGSWVSVQREPPDLLTLGAPPLCEPCPSQDVLV